MACNELEKLEICEGITSNVLTSRDTFETNELLRLFNRLGIPFKASWSQVRTSQVSSVRDYHHTNMNF